MTDNFNELVFNDSIKEPQKKYWTRTTYARMEQSGT
jgi:hypothetical protein